LKAWPKVELVSFYVLRTAFQSTAQGSDGMALIPFPTQELFEKHLDEFDVVILQEFDPGAVEVDRYLDRIAEFVNHGGALVLIGGAEGLDAAKLPSKDFKATLPMELLGAAASGVRSYDASPFRPRLAEAGINHPLTRLESARARNEETYRSLARLDGIGRVAALAEGAFSLLEHPSLQAADGPAPLLAVRDVGRGRSMAVATDSLWRWGFTGPMTGGPPDVYARLWRQSISWLTRAPELDRLRVDVDPPSVGVGQPTTFTMELLDEVYRPMPGMRLDCVVSRQTADGTETEERFEVLLDEDGRYQREWTPAEEGPHALEVIAASGQKAIARFLAATERVELAHLEPRPELLEELARRTGGHFEEGVFAPETWELGVGSARRVETQTELTLWDHPLALVLFVALLVGEWLLRRRLGLT
jgi:hypothetical protein